MTRFPTFRTALLALGVAVAAAPLPLRAEAVEQVVSGTASWYGPGFHGRQTANGETFDMNALTAAHPSLPFGTRVRVTYGATGDSVVVRINDRGPFHGGRAIDLSREAAQEIGLDAAGVGRVTLEVLA